MSYAEHQITPIKTLVQVIVALTILTILTVIMSRIDLGMLHLPMALLIAGIKAALVVMIFMGLRNDNRVNGLIFTVGAVFVVVFIVFTLFDTEFRGDLSNTTEGTIMEQEAGPTGDLQH
jgi:cytochrome c oxidase subunit IV